MTTGRNEKNLLRIKTKSYILQLGKIICRGQEGMKKNLESKYAWNLLNAIWKSCLYHRPEINDKDEPAASDHSACGYRRGNKGRTGGKTLGKEEVANPSNSFRAILFRVRKLLKEQGLPESDYIISRKGVYCWTPEIPYHCDCISF